MTHALLSPSAAHRWAACPGSVALTKDLPDSSSSYAEEGTLAHAYAAHKLGGEQLQSLAVISREMEGEVQKYLDLVWSLVGATRGTLLVEQRFDMSEVVPECQGTADAVIVADDELIVIDLKYGKGQKVDAFYLDGDIFRVNKQLGLYGFGAWLTLYPVADFKRVRVMVCQPRLDGGPFGHVSEFTLTIVELSEFASEMERAAEAALESLRGEDALLHLSPSTEACRWCRAKATCPALRQQVELETQCNFEDLTAPVVPAAAAPNLDLARAMKMVELIEDWCKGVRAATEAELFRGVPVPGWKLVAGRKGTRRWADEEEVAKVLHTNYRMPVDEVYERQLRSPAQIEKVMASHPKRWERMQKLITQSEGRASVAPETDKRPALQLPNAADFPNLDAEELA